MTHELTEVVIPPTDDVTRAVGSALELFDEAQNPRFGWWDWWTIGGRYSGEKELYRLGRERVDAFQDQLGEQGITIDVVQFGKPRLSPEGQREVVDREWRERFPESRSSICLLFDYAEDMTDLDIVPFRDVHPDTMADRVLIVAPPRHGRHEKFMVTKKWFNGLQWQDALWDGKVTSAVEEFNERALRPVGGDWLVVTVDSHS